MAITDRKQREKQARRQLILNAAARIFARYGYHSASMDLIAEEAELGKATLYYYYKNKNDLLLGILTQGIKDFFSQLERRLATTGDPIEKLEMVIEESMRFFQSHPDFFKLYMYLNVHPTFRQKIYEQMHPLLIQKIGLIKDIFIEAQNEQRITDIPADYLLSIFGSLVMGTGIFSGRQLRSDQLAKQARYLTQILFYGILTEEQRTEQTIERSP